MRQMNPNVNMNGATRESLVNQRMAVVHALNAVMGAMRDMVPHGRDYQGLPEEEALTRYRNDRDLWNTRFDEVVRLHTEIEAEALAIHEGGY